MARIYGERIRFRAPERSDLSVFVEWFNDPEVTAGLFNYLPMSLAEEEGWFENMLKRPPAEHPLVIEIWQDDAWQMIGNCSFMEFDQVARSAELGIVIGEKAYWNQGFGTEAIKLLLKHVFETLNLHRIFLRVKAYNERAIHVYEQIGFVHEGRMRDAVFYQGAYYDMLFMSVLRHEWDT